MSPAARATLLSLTASLFIAMPSVARAGSYTVYGCQVPGGAAAPMDGWHANLDNTTANNHVYWLNDCPSQVYMTMSSAHSHSDGAFAAETFVAPANTTIRSYTIWRAVRLLSGSGYYYQLWDYSAGQRRLVNGCSGPAGCKSFGDYQHAFAKSNAVTHTAEAGTTEVQLKVLCGNAGGCPAAPGQVIASVRLFRSDIKLSDSFAPQFAGSPTGPLVTPGQVLTGIVPVTIAATDRGGGVDQATIAVDGQLLQGQVLDSNGGRCQQPFVLAVPCKPGVSGTVYFDTRRLGDGSHALTLGITDAAGNVATWGPVAITTVNNPCSPVPAAAGMRLRAAFAITTRRRIRIHGHRRVVKRVRFARKLTANYGQHPVVLGGLTTTSGTPVPGARVCIAAQNNLRGAPLTPAGAVTTNAGGGFLFRLAPGPSRTVYMIYRVPTGAIFAKVHITVHAPVHIHVNRFHFHNGDVMSWTGHLPGPIPHGMLALMQVWRGSYWQDFQKVAVDRHGRWRGRYRFAFTTGDQRYTFRLLVPQQAGYPYAAGHTPAFHVTVTG